MNSSDEQPIPARSAHPIVPDGQWALWRRPITPTGGSLKIMDGGKPADLVEACGHGHARPTPRIGSPIVECNGIAVQPRITSTQRPARVEGPTEAS
jgi:hypothetical protein